MTPIEDPSSTAHLRPLHHRRLWLGVWAFGWLLCIALSLISPPDLPETPPLSDKVGHLLAYGVLAAWAVQIFRPRGALLASLVALVLLGVALELAQGGLTETRKGDPRDALANTLGVMLGGALVFTPLRNLLSVVETRWRR